MHLLSRLTIVIFLTLLSITAFADDLKYFKDSYNESRQQFLEHVESITQQKNINVVQAQFPDPQDSTLITDAAWLQATPQAKNLILVSSGIHGIEGFTGSALQSMMLARNFNKPLNNIDYLFVHAVNPFGFKNFRRVNANNIDLNRHFIFTDKNTLNKANTAYAEMNLFLNPDKPVSLGFYHKIEFIFSAVKLILKYSMESLRQSILLGQYEFPKGLYFGGTTPQYQVQMWDQIADNILKKYQNVFIIDIHTGYGEKNKLHILSTNKDQKNADFLIKVFGEKRIDFGDKNKFYTIQGDLLSYLSKKSTKNTEIHGTVFEYGTLDSQKTLGSIESLRRMILENQNYHFGATDLGASLEVKKLFKDLFYPQDEVFYKNVFEQSEIEIDKIKIYLKNSASRF